MKEKILALFKESRGQTSQVSDRTLESLADQYAKFVTTDEQLALLDGKIIVDNLQGNIDFVSKGVKEATVKEAEKEAAIAKAKKEAEEAAAGANGGAAIPPATGGETPVEKELRKELANFGAQLAEIRSGAVKEARLAKIKNVYAGMPAEQIAAEESLYDSLYGVMPTETFEAVMKQRETANKSFLEATKAQGLDFSIPTKSQREKNDGQSPMLKNAREVVKKTKDDKK